MPGSWHDAKYVTAAIISARIAFYGSYMKSRVEKPLSKVDHIYPLDNFFH